MRIGLSIMLCVLFAEVCTAQPALETCSRFEWDYATDTSVQFFRLYVSQTSGGYTFGQAFPTMGGYVAQPPAIPDMVTHVLCHEVHLTQPGTYFAVVTAVRAVLQPDQTIKMEESGPSNEITFTYRNQSPAPPTPPRPPGSPAPPPSLPPVPPPIMPPAVAGPPAIGGPSGGGLLSDTCMWTGTCRR